MSRPCWHFLQAGHSLTSVLIRHPLPPIRRPLAAFQAGPAVPGAEHFREVVHPIEVFDLVARLSRQQADVDQGEDDVAEVLGAGDPRSEEHTSELQSQSNLVCRLLLEKKKHQPRSITALAVIQMHVVRSPHHRLSLASCEPGTETCHTREHVSASDAWTRS